MKYLSCLKNVSEIFVNTFEYLLKLFAYTIYCISCLIKIKANIIFRICKV